MRLNKALILILSQPQYSHGIVSNLRRSENQISSDKSITTSTNNSEFPNENIFWNRILGSSLPQLYELKVSNGVGDGDYQEGARVEIVATPCPTNEKFDEWIVLGGDPEIDDVTAKVTTLTMPDEDSRVRATCKKRDSTDAPTSTDAPSATDEPSATTTMMPTPKPTNEPTKPPTSPPTLKPTRRPTDEPTKTPTTSPTPSPTSPPSPSPTPSPTLSPTNDPTNSPTLRPTPSPTRPPTVTNRPTPPTTAGPDRPTPSPSSSPTIETVSPTSTPSASPTLKVTEVPTVSPSLSPVVTATESPTPSVTDDFAYVCEQYTPWDNLDPTLRTSAIEDLGYTSLSWNVPYPPTANRIEQRSWDGLGRRRQGGATVIGFDQETWDCQVNHYEDYDWDELVEEEVQDCFVGLGYDEPLWNRGGGVPADEKTWAELTPEERAGADCVCFFESLWMEVPLGEEFVATPC